MKLKQEDWSIYWSLTSPEKNKVTGQASNPAESEDPLQLTKLTSESGTMTSSLTRICSIS